MASSWTYPAIVDHLVDGDTLCLVLDLGLHIYRKENVRIAHINAPELSTQAGRDALTYAATVVHVGDPVSFVSTQLDKYGRPLGTMALANGQDYGKLMLESGHAVPYEGGAKLYE